MGDLRHGRALQRRDGEGRKPDQLPSRDGLPGARAGVGFAQGRHPARLPRRDRSGSTPSCWHVLPAKRNEPPSCGAPTRSEKAQPRRRWCHSWSCRCQTGRRTNSSCRRLPPSGTHGQSSNRTRWPMCSAITPRSSSEVSRSRTSAPRRCRTAPTSACCSPRTRSRPAGIAPVQRFWCRSGPPVTIPTSPSFSDGWSARPWLGGCPAMTC